MIPLNLPYLEQNWNLSIEIHSRNTIQEINPETKHYIISICEPHKDFSRIPQNDKCIGVLFQKYTDSEYADRLNEHSLFTIAQASQVWRKILEHREDLELLICQCDGGISRSSATAAAVSRIINGDDRWIFRSQLYNPNKLVYYTLLNVFRIKYQTE